MNKYITQIYELSLKNNYADSYIELIQYILDRNLPSRKEAKKVLGYVEEHHIIPSCMKGEDINENLVYCTGEEHFKLHYYLTFMFHENFEFRSKLIYAAWSMANKNSKPNKNKSKHQLQIDADLYQNLREIASVNISTSLKGKKKGTLEERYGKERADEMKEFLSKVNKERTFSPETRIRMSKARIGKPSNNKGVLMKEEQKQKISNTRKERKIKPWNTGKSWSEEQKQNLSKAQLGRTLEEIYGEEGAIIHRHKLIKAANQLVISDNMLLDRLKLWLETNELPTIISENMDSYKRYRIRDSNKAIAKKLIELGLLI